MKITLKNGKTIEVSNPREQKVFRANGEDGWIITFSILTPMTSNELDELITLDNISEMTMSETEVTIVGYNKISMLTIRYSSDGNSVVDVQLTKGL